MVGRMRRLAFAVLGLSLALAAAPARAQSGIEIDCPATVQSLAVTNPGLHCTCSCATCRPSCSQDSSTSSSSTSAISNVPVLTTKQAVQMQVASTLIDAFFNMLFSTDSKADAQKQQMMAELERRRAEAEQQHRIEEAMKLAAICSRLQATL